ncbi:MAG: TonB-dependent receptor [Prevotellaceae bacterium]|jgi:outer membrane receptor for ferrienterochelin and colicin|nr:TonB-dependent receptor [Prevotellaceae bacterium]
MKKNLLFQLIVFFCIAVSASARNYTVSGYIVSDKSGETLISAAAVETGSNKGTLSNSFGFYSLTLDEGKVNMRYSCLSYASVSVDFVLTKDTVLNIRLKEDNILEEIVIVADRIDMSAKSSQMSAINVPAAQIKSIPALFGEVDLIKALQLLPGVQSGTEGFTGFYVRGGGPDENLFLLDGVPVYNINHMFGFFSVFNPDAVKNVTLYKGSFPARFGGRLSSVLDIRMNDGNSRKLSGSASIGLISSKLNLEGPLFSENTTFNISARRTYLDILLQPFMKQASEGELSAAGYYFYDINAKLTHRFSDNDRLFLSFYTGDDVIYANTSDNNFMSERTTKTKMDWNWGNLLLALRWNHIINNKLFMNTTMTYTRYRFDLGIRHSQESRYTDDGDFDTQLGYKSGIEDIAAKVDFDWMPNPDNEIKFGINYINHRFRPGVTAADMKDSESGISIDTAIGDKNIRAGDISLYAEDNISISKLLKINAGLHYSAFMVQNKFYNSLQPRLSMRFLLSDKFSVKTGYAYMSQYIHLLSNSSISLPTDLWVPVTKRIIPMNSHQVSVGAFYNLNDFLDISVEGYYKTMNNLIEYKDGATFLGSSTGWEDKVATGRGKAYGIELLAQKTVGQTTGWIGYTLAKTDRTFDRKGEELNFGKTFPAKYDRRHDINIVVMHKFSERIDISATWIYSSGNCATLGMYKFEDENGSEHIYVNERNNFRYPDYHRLDMSLNLHKKKKYGQRTWSFSVYNIYNRTNPFYVYPSEGRLKQITLFPIIPSISYTYRF